MKIVVVGAGYVGLVSGACFSEFGIRVTCVDNDAEKVARLNAGEIPLYEPGLEELVARNARAGRFVVCADLDAVADADAVFIAVGTPSRRGDGHADLSYVYAAAREVAARLARRTVIVLKSTVPVGTGAEVERIVADARPDLRAGEGFDVASNPEFLREGSAIEDFMRPDRVVVGAESDHAREVIAALYRPLYIRDTPFLFASRETAELTKYAANAFLAARVAFIDEIADLCEATGADVQGVARGIGLDRRIGGKFLHPGPGYGGSCFPKDTRALARIGQEAGAPLSLVETVIDSNERRKARMARRVRDACGGSVEGLTVALLGFAFKPNTDDTRDSPSRDIAQALLKAGARVRVYDPRARCDVEGAETVGAAEAAIAGADALVVATEWNEFRGLDPARIRSLLRRPLVIDLRNVYRPEDMRAAGLRYLGVGRGTRDAA